MKPIRTAVIGTGSISDFHLKSYARHPDAELVAVCDLNAERARKKADQFGAAKSYSDYKELLADPDIDAVSVCTWNNTHAEISIAALRAGKHVLVEKPLCTTVEEALRIREAVEETGKQLMIGYVRRYDPNARLLKEFVDKGEFGDLYYAKASSIRRHGNPGGWFADRSRSGGGPLIDIGVHMIDLCWYMMGKPKAVTVSGNTYRKLGNRANIRNLSHYKAADWDPKVNTVEDLASAMIRFENGASLQVDVSFALHAQKDEASIKLYGDKGGFEIDPEIVIVTEKHDTILNVTPQTDHRGFHFEAAFQSEIDHFVECVREGRKPISPVEDGVEMMKILNAVYESAERREEIRL
ncbi:MAG: oxidoreductase [Cohnella sp.]|uniref:Gfo/Idh/MocA family protein n=1 Tax=Cohnella sp. TaxID=1883426 RepID=UPI000E377220|nr:Gfo/Idh/MocA family oxidoreductase [Cohnella sp.]REK66229.1 MAG: oxidoreductase [Cohnella sp.]